MPYTETEAFLTVRRKDNHHANSRGIDNIKQRYIYEKY